LTIIKNYDKIIIESKQEEEIFMTKLTYVVTFKNGSTVEVKTLAEARAFGSKYEPKYTKTRKVILNG